MIGDVKSILFPIQRPFVFLGEPATPFSLSNEEGVPWVKVFGVCCFPPKIHAPFSLGSCAVYHTRGHGHFIYSSFFAIVNRMTMNNLWGLKLAKVGFCCLQTQNTDWSMWEYRKSPTIMCHYLKFIVPYSVHIIIKVQDFYKSIKGISQGTIAHSSAFTERNTCTHLSF